MKVLGIETSCDETAVAVVEEGKKILIQRIASQVEIHEAYGGVFPELASREHSKMLLPLIEETMKECSTIDLIAVTNGPGLMGSLLMGVTAAQALSCSWNLPLIGVNHVKAHLYAALMGECTPALFPALGVVLSGGHTFLAKMDGINSYEILSTTVDDAIGEAFDKVAALLDLPYPGGPEIEKLAQNGDPYRYSLRAGQVKKLPLHFSFSGLKTNVLYTIKGKNADKHLPTTLPEAEKKHLAASFQRAAFKDVVKKSLKAAKTFPCKAIYLGGGVTASQALKDLFCSYESPYPLFYPPSGLSLDNAAMIAGMGYHLYKQGEVSDPLQIKVFSRFN